MPKNSLKNWKFIPSLKGKQAQYHIFILRTLAIKGSKSCWDLALEFLKENEPKFSQWTKYQIDYERKNRNSSFNKRLKFLQSKHYVQKLGSLYKLTFKGEFLAFILDPGIIQEIHNDLFNETIQTITLEEKPPQFGIQENWTDKETEVFKSVFKDPTGNEIFSSIARRMIIAWKINMDDISEVELLKLLISRVKKQTKKLGKNSLKISFA